MALNIPPLPEGTSHRTLPSPTVTVTITRATLRKMRADITFNRRLCEVTLNIGGVNYPVESLSLQDAIYSHD